MVIPHNINLNKITSVIAFDNSLGLLLNNSTLLYDVVNNKFQNTSKVNILFPLISTNHIIGIQNNSLLKYSVVNNQLQEENLGQLLPGKNHIVAIHALSYSLHYNDSNTLVVKTTETTARLKWKEVVDPFPITYFVLLNYSTYFETNVSNIELTNLQPNTLNTISIKASNFLTSSLFNSTEFSTNPLPIYNEKFVSATNRSLVISWQYIQTMQSLPILFFICMDEVICQQLFNVKDDRATAQFYYDPNYYDRKLINISVVVENSAKKISQFKFINAMIPRLAPNITSIFVFGDYAIVSWAPLTASNGTLIKYQLIVFDQNNNIIYNKVTEQIKVIILQLSSQTLYTIQLVSVFWFNNVELKSNSPTSVAFRSLDNLAPTQGPVITIVEVFLNEAKVFLHEIPLQTRGTAWIQYYVFTILQSEGVHNITVTSTEDVVLNELQPNTQYTVSVLAVTSVGVSPSSPSIIFATLQDKQAATIEYIIIGTIIGVVAATVIVVLLILFIVVVIIILTLFVVSKRRKYNQDPTSKEHEMIKIFSDKEFQIDVSKLDLDNAINIGSGASGIVVKTKYFNNDVAVKLFCKTNSGIENDLTEFHNELQFLKSKTQHQNIIRFFGVFENIKHNSVGLIMEYCSNGTVATYVTNHQHLSFDFKVSLIKGIASGMQYLHFYNIAHRDLKCENVLLDSALAPKIIDFGFSRVIKEDTNKSLNLTMNIGTAAYCAPEIIKIQFQTPNNALEDSTNFETNSSISNSQMKLAYDKKCDVYSFAIIIWVIYFQKKNPYGNNIADIQILKQLSIDPNFRPTINEDLIKENERWLLDLMKQCWSLYCDARPSFQDICTILNNH